eukprot:5969534-Amphidinium_carterae.2
MGPEAYYDSVEDLARRLLGAFALALDLPEEWFNDKLDRLCRLSDSRACQFDQCVLSQLELQKHLGTEAQTQCM